MSSRILFINPEGDESCQIVSIFESAGFEVLFIPGVMQALRDIRGGGGPLSGSATPQLVVIDMDEDVGTARILVEYLKKSFASNYAPVLGLSSPTPPRMVAANLAVGFEHVFFRPLDLKDLLKKARSYTQVVRPY